jgi:hypothetical protein
LELTATSFSGIAPGYSRQAGGGGCGKQDGSELGHDVPLMFQIATLN